MIMSCQPADLDPYVGSGSYLDCIIVFLGLTITGTEYVNQYSDIHLKCNATGVERAPDDIDWFFNGNKIHTTHPRWYGRIEILKQKPIPGRSYISDLIIHLSTMADQGNYVCRSSDLSANNMKVHVLNGKSRTLF